MENDPVKILITYGEAIELKNAGIFEDFYQCFSHLKIPDNEDPYSLGFGLSFDRDWICQLFKKNHFKDFAVIACVMTEIILPHVNNMISPPIKPNELEQIIDIEYKHLERNFKQWLKNKEIEKIIQRFCIPTPLFYPKSKLKYGSFFFWIDYICSIRDKGYNILENEAKKGNDVCLKIALIEFGNQDNNRLSAEWEGLIKTRFPKLEFYLSNNPLPKIGIPIRKVYLSDQNSKKITEQRIENDNYIWAVDNFWKSLKQYNPKRKKRLNNWLADGIKYTLMNRNKRVDPIFTRRLINIEELEENGRAIDENIIESDINHNNPTSEAVKKAFKSLNKNKKLDYESLLGRVTDLESLKEKDVAKILNISAKTIQRRRKKPK